MQKRRVSTRHIQNHTSGSEFEAVLQSCCLVEDEVVRSAVRILEEVTEALELNRYSRVVFKERWFCVTLSDHK